MLDLFIRTAQIEGTALNDFDEVIGRRRRANLDFTFFNEGFSMGRFNEYSYLGDTQKPQKADSTIRLAFIGDSYVESFQLFRRDQFYSILENDLTKKLGRNVKTLNFGRSGFDLADMYAYQQRLVSQFHPDYIFYFLDNADLNCTQADPLVPKVVVKGDSLQVVNDLMPKYAKNIFIKTNVILQNSSVLTMANKCSKLIKAGMFWPKILDKFYLPSKSSVTSSTKETEEVPELAFKIVENLSENSIVVNRGEADFPASFLKAINGKSLFMIDLRDTLSVLKHQGTDPNFWPVTQKRGHWNYEAHQAIGYFLSHKIENLVNSKREK
ncbi:MAG: SGNH/GDSL hydrolase family protein [Candidatus Kuenenia stuttgartiensis]|nr:SGNH/GDSL hydrolase family protein [Candidatus Kuenenia stuttgartiensis]